MLIPEIEAPSFTAGETFFLFGIADFLKFRDKVEEELENVEECLVSPSKGEDEVLSFSDGPQKH